MVRVVITFVFALMVSATAWAGNWNQSGQGKNEYKTYKGLPCSFFGAKFGAINRNATVGNLVNRCSDHKGYKNKQGASLYLKRGTPILAPTDLFLVKAQNKTAQRRCKGNYNCQTPYDDLHLWFEDVNANVFYFYHLMEENPFVVGFGKGSCNMPNKFGTEHHKREPENCGGYQKRTVQKGEVIGYSGQTGSHPHISFAVQIWNHPDFPEQKGWVVPFNSLTWENSPSDDPMIYLFPVKKP